MNFKKYHVSKNLFDKSADRMVGNAALGSELPTGIRTTVQTVGNNRYTSILLSRGDELLGKTLTISATITPSAENNGNIRFYWLNNISATALISAPLTIKEGNVHGTFKIPNSYPSNTNGMAIIFSANVDGNCEVGDYVDYTDVMLNIGDIALPYEPYGNSWHDVPYYVHNTDTDTITTLPAVLYPTGTTATVGLKGQAIQSTTPTPDNPVMPQGTGERTGNLFDVSTATNEFINTNGSITPATAGDPYYLSDYISADNATISVQYKETAAAEIFTVGVYDSSKSFIRRDVISNNSVSYENVAYIRINYRDKNCQNVMLNTGSTALPYEPYGYKIPISSANTTTPVYLGEVETTRKIKKYEFTGQEADLKMQAVITATNAIQLPTTLSDYKKEPFICSHMPVSSSSGGSATHGFYGQFLTLCFEKSMGLDTLEKMQTYLQQQYAVGTPVTVWYVLATEVSSVVNEPLMKIGDYADTVSNVSIPVTAGGDTLSVGTTVHPSEITANYKGWHPKTPKESNNGSWT